MQWGALLLFIISLYAGYKFLGFTKKNESLKFLGLSIASFILAFSQFSLLMDDWLGNFDLTMYSDVVVEWGHIISLAFVLSALAVFIRQSKPVFAQFPLIYTALPLLIVLSFFLVQDTYALKDWLFSIYQAGAIFVALLMYAVYSYKEQKYVYILAGVILFLVTFVLFWYIPGVQECTPLLWKAFLSLSIMLTIYGYDYARKETNSTNTTQLNNI
jgi:hypothetical protein